LGLALIALQLWHSQEICVASAHFSEYSESFDQQFPQKSPQTRAFSILWPQSGEVIVAVGDNPQKNSRSFCVVA
jgi:hypothetical protein